MDLLTRIYDDQLAFLEERSTEECNSSLLCGDWGVLLFLFYYEHFFDPSQDNAAAVLQALYERLDEDGEAGYNFCNGLTGAFWILQHLNEQGLAELDLEELTSEFINVAIEESKEYLAAKNFDYLHGSAGIVNFLIPFAGTQEVRAHLELFVANLATISKATREGISLPVFNPIDEPGVWIDSLSMAHGSCGLLIILARIHEAGIAKDECSRLIYGSVDFVRSQRIGQKEEVSVFAPSLYPNTLDGKSNWSRVSWCYGDLSVALALWHCGQYFKEGKWTAEALDILQYNTNRIGEQNTGINDSCFCHGAAGAAVIYRKFWQETGIQAFYDFSEYWYQYLLNDTSLAEHRLQKGVKVAAGGSWLYRSDLLNGSAGVGLALLSRLHEKPLAWYDCFLISSVYQ